MACKEAEALERYISMSSGAELAINAPKMGKTSHAKIPCVSQKFSHDHSLILLMGTYELDWPILPTAIISKPKIVFIRYTLFEVTSFSYACISLIYASPTGTSCC